MKNLLKVSLVVGLLVVAAPVMAQMVPAAGQAGFVTVTNNGQTGVVNAVAGGPAPQVVNWTSFALNPGGTLDFINNVNAVVNTVQTSSAQIYGNINSYLGANAASGVGGDVYFFAPGGIAIGKGATIQTGGFLAVAAQYNPNLGWAGSAQGTAWQYPLANSFGFDGYWDVNFTVQSPTSLTVGAAGTSENLWIIGLVDGNIAGQTSDYGIGAHWLNRCIGDAYKNIATLTFDPAWIAPGVPGNVGSVFANSVNKKMWLGTVNAPSYDVALNGGQIWLPRITASSFAANGGTNQFWNSGVWVYGNSNPLTWPHNSKADPNAIITTGLTGFGDVWLDGTWLWVTGNTDATGRVVAGDGALGNPPSSTLSIWTLDIRSRGVDATGQGGYVDLSATGRAVTDVKVPVIGKIPAGTTGTVSVRDIQVDNLNNVPDNPADPSADWVYTEVRINAWTAAPGVAGSFVARDIVINPGVGGGAVVDNSVNTAVLGRNNPGGVPVPTTPGYNPRVYW